MDRARNSKRVCMSMQGTRLPRGSYEYEAGARCSDQYVVWILPLRRATLDEPRVLDLRTFWNAPWNAGL